MSTDVNTENVVTRGSRLAIFVSVAVLLAVVAAGIMTRATESSHLATWTDAQAVPTVTVVTPLRASTGPVLDLPGRLEAYSRAPIYARVSGYLQSWMVDIGARVKEGQLLAVIQTPELDQQLLEARADLASAEAASHLAATTANRWQGLLDSDSVSRQEVDERAGDFASKQAMVASAKANVERLIATKRFQRVTAPFEGIVTTRGTDIGALINSGSNGGGQELFTVSDVSRLRAYVQIPQSYGPQVTVGTIASLVVPEYPGRRFPARVIASADAVTAVSGTTLVQLLVDNSEGKLMPGEFTSVAFALAAQPDILRLPSSALIFDSRGLRIAIVNEKNQVQFKTVTIARDFGDSIEIGSGLSSTDRVIDTPPDGLADGDKVQLANVEKPGK